MKDYGRMDENMTVRDLSRERLGELKQAYAAQLSDSGEGENVFGISYEELTDAVEIPDEVIFDHYDGIVFTEDDFFCSC